MEVKDALNLMLSSCMLLLALLSYLNKK
ncbi:putative holin-like toxin [Cohnella kolymensis]